ncbi:cytochrome P450 [Naviculisporaceae sp. PSN 640]
MLGLNTLGLIGLTALIWVICTARYIWWRFFSYQNIPKTIPWVGTGPDSKNPFSRAKVALKSFFGLKPLLIDGYEEYSKRNRVFILPNIVNGHEVILPTQQMPWLLEQPDTVLSQYETNRQFMCGDYTMLNLLGPDWPRLPEIVKRATTRDLDDFVEAMADETQDSLKSLWGFKTGGENAWHEIDLYEVMLEVVARISNRVFVGNPLCRNPSYLQASSGFGKYILLWAMAIEMLPAFFKPIFGPLLTGWDFYRHYKRIQAYITPVIKDRLAQQQQQQDTYYDHAYMKSSHRPTPPNDYVTWALKDMARHGEDPNANLPRTCEMIAKRLALTSFTAIQSSAITITNVVVDIASNPLSYSVQDALRSELNSHFESFAQADSSTVLSGKISNIWTRPSLSKLPLLDSALTETLRLWGILTHGVTKAVVHPAGVTLPSGEHIPCGAKVGIASYGPHLDENVYGANGTSSPLVWDVFRFAKLNKNDSEDVKFRHNSGSSGGSASEDDSGSDFKSGMEKTTQSQKGPTSQPGLRFVSTSEFYMGFSHGRHACPGRFFANSLLKILLAHIVLMYDIQPLQERPSNPWLNNTIGPPIGTLVKVRRRKDTST